MGSNTHTDLMVVDGATTLRSARIATLPISILLLGLLLVLGLIIIS